MKETELIRRCKASFASKCRRFTIPYHSAEIYSLGKHIRTYGYYPPFLPLCIYTDHGPATDRPFKHELESDAPSQLYHSSRIVEQWKLVSSKPCYVLYSPFVFYRRTRGITRSANAGGTIAFPAHTTAEIDDVSDIEAYIHQLRSLPAPFQPVSACLHMTDIKRGRYKLFEKHGIPVYTAGNALDDRFAERFYAILRRFSFATSNMIGSYTYYAVEMGIPFSIYGNKPVLMNSGDRNVTMGEFDPYRESSSYRAMYHLFLGLHREISTEQRERVEIELGLRDGISRVRMSRVLYSSLFRWALSGRSIRFFISGFRKLLDRPRPERST